MSNEELNKRIAEAIKGGEWEVATVMSWCFGEFGVYPSEAIWPDIQKAVEKYVMIELTAFADKHKIQSFPEQPISPSPVYEYSIEHLWQTWLLGVRNPKISMMEEYKEEFNAWLKMGLPNAVNNKYSSISGESPVKQEWPGDISPTSSLKKTTWTNRKD